MITVVGSANIDFVTRTARLPARGETVSGGNFFRAFGGKGANQALAAARAGAAVKLLACLGSEPYADEMLQALAAAGVDVADVRRSRTAATGTALIMVDERGENYISVAPGANHELSPADIERHAPWLVRSSFVLAQLELSRPTTEKLLEHSSQGSARLLLNYAPAGAADLPLSSGIYGLIVNETEAESLLGARVDVHGARAAASALLERGPALVAITLGASGAALVSRSEAALIPAPRVEVRDTTAAGDTFCGALALALAEARSLADAGRFACAAAALAVTRLGAQPSIPERAEIDALLARA